MPTDVGITAEDSDGAGWSRVEEKRVRRRGENTLRGMDLYYVTAAAGSPSRLMSGRRLELITHYMLQPMTMTAEASTRRQSEADIY